MPATCVRSRLTNGCFLPAYPHHRVTVPVARGEGLGQDLDELMEISDRFAALNEGALSDARPAAGLTVDEIGLMMGGAHGMEVAHSHGEGAAS